MKNMPVITILLLLFTGCTNEEVARNALDKARFYDIEITGYSLFSCAASDFIHTGFKAKNAFGEPVQGVVCSSPFSDRPVIKK